jgi:hypothetical protein
MKDENLAKLNVDRVFYLGLLLTAQGLWLILRGVETLAASWPLSSVVPISL